MNNSTATSPLGLTLDQWIALVGTIILGLILLQGWVAEKRVQKRFLLEGRADVPKY